jgi:hypothetical protein
VNPADKVKSQAILELKAGLKQQVSKLSFFQKLNPQVLTEIANQRGNKLLRFHLSMCLYLLKHLWLNLLKTGFESGKEGRRELKSRSIGVFSGD